MTSNTWPRPTLDLVASYFEDDAVVSAISLIFTGIAEPWTSVVYNISVFC